MNFVKLLSDLIVPLPDVGATNDRLITVINVVLGITGAIAVLIVVLAGFRLVISQGNPSEVSIARNAIIYASVGLIVIMFAFAIINFVVRSAG